MNQPILDDPETSVTDADVHDHAWRLVAGHPGSLMEGAHRMYRCDLCSSTWCI